MGRGEDRADTLVGFWLYQSSTHLIVNFWEEIMSNDEASKNIVLKGKYVIPVIKTSGPMGDGIQYVYRFRNGYGASVINHSGSYGVELAVVEWDDWTSDHDDYTLCYTTPVAGDVLGWLTFDELILKLGEIQDLPIKPESQADVFGIEQ